MSFFLGHFFRLDGTAGDGMHREGRLLGFFSLLTVTSRPLHKRRVALSQDRLGSKGATMYATTSLQSIEVANAIYGRRSIRRYTSEPVSRKSLEELIAAAVQAPSAMNDQPWGFAVVTGAQRLRAFSDRAKAYALDLLDGPFPHPIKALTDINMFNGAPCLVVICATSQGTQAAEDCCLAAENLMLAAFASGLGTCPIGLARPWLSLSAIKQELGIPQNWTPIFPIVVGVPDERPEAPGRREPRIVIAPSSSLDAY
jgi:nitroreductase